MFINYTNHPSASWGEKQTNEAKKYGEIRDMLFLNISPQMTIQELGTIMQEKLNVKIIILNNNFLGMVRQWQELFFHERYSNTIMENPDFVAIAKAYGIASRAVEKREELDDAIAEMLNHDGAYVLVANVETCGMVYPMVPAGGSVTNMIMGDEK